MCGKKAPVSTWKDADAIFSQIAQTAPTSGGYDKCDFTVTFEDGETYSGRMDIKGGDNANESLAQHIGQFAQFYAGLWKPDHLTQKQYDDFLRNNDSYNPGIAEEYKNFLSTYEVPVC